MAESKRPFKPKLTSCGESIPESNENVADFTDRACHFAVQGFGKGHGRTRWSNEVLVDIRKAVHFHRRPDCAEGTLDELTVVCNSLGEHHAGVEGRRITQRGRAATNQRKQRLNLTEPLRHRDDGRGTDAFSRVATSPCLCVSVR